MKNTQNIFNAPPVHTGGALVRLKSGEDMSALLQRWVQTEDCIEDLYGFSTQAEWQQYISQQYCPEIYLGLTLEQLKTIPVELINREIVKAHEVERTKLIADDSDFSYEVERELAAAKRGY